MIAGGQRDRGDLRLVAHLPRKTTPVEIRKAFTGDSVAAARRRAASHLPLRAQAVRSCGVLRWRAQSHFFGFGENAMQWPCRLISPSTILHVPLALAVLPDTN